MKETLDYECMGARIRYQRKGAGPTLLLLKNEEALPGDTAFIDELAKSFDMIVPDHPGFGLSDTPGWLRGMGDTAYFYLDFIEALKLDRLHVVGCSVGGWIAAEIAVRDCRQIASLSLLAPYGVRKSGVPFGDVFIWTPEENVRKRVRDQKLVDAFMARQKTKEEEAALLKDRYGTARLAWNPRFFNPELQRWLHRIKPPLQTIWGDQDELAPMEIFDAWKAGLPDAKNTVIKDCGHLPHFEHPEKSAAIVRQFISEVRP
jgi:pimeloyl-ACP methyl ester carboxylesterase